jgi:hypothetical protein
LSVLVNGKTPACNRGLFFFDPVTSLAVWMGRFGIPDVIGWQGVLADRGLTEI